MQKIGLLFLVLTLTVAASSQAADAVSTVADSKPIPFVMDIKKQVRLPATIKIKKAVDSIGLLSEAGDIYSLTGLDIPDDNETAPKTQKRLAELTEGKKCTIYQTRSEKVGRVNRMNQIVGHFTCGTDDRWIQGTLIAEGLARVRTTPENNDKAAEMFALEQKARDQKLGLWALPMNAILTPASAAQRINSFGIVQGKIYATSQNRNAIFLNFTPDWKTDFSIGIASTLRKDFSKQRIDPMSLKGKTIRVRGWIRSYNGPYIELDHVEQLEILASAKDDPKLSVDQKEMASPDQQMENRATKVLDSIMDAAAPRENVEPQKQFMHTLGGKKTQSLSSPDTPQITEPKAPEVKKPVVAPVRKTANP